MNLCVNVYLDSVSACLIVKLIILLDLLLGHMLFIILNVSSGGTRLCIDMHFYTNIALENVLQATMIFLTVVALAFWLIVFLFWSVSDSFNNCVVNLVVMSI